MTAQVLQFPVSAAPTAASAPSPSPSPSNISRVSTVSAATSAALYPAVWVLAFLPVSVLVVADVIDGIARPLTWAARFLPAMLAVAPVAWASISKSHRALRLRKEFRLIAGSAISLLVTSGTSLLADAPIPLTWRYMFVFGGNVANIGIVAMVAITAWADEKRFGTLSDMAMSPRASLAGLEKSAVSAYFIVLSSLYVVGGSETMSELTLGVYCLAIATAAALFFLVHHGTHALALFILIPGAIIAVPTMLLGFELPAIAVKSLVTLYGFTVLMMTPRIVKRYLERPQARLVGPVKFSWVSGLKQRSPMLGVEEQLLRPVLMLTALMPLLFVGMWMLGPRAAQDGLFLLPMALGFMVCALGPAFTFSESRDLVTSELAHHPRARVFGLKLISSFVSTLVGGVIVPLALVQTTTPMKSDAMAAWVVAAVGLWAMSVALSTVMKATGNILVTSFGFGVVLAAAQINLVEVGVYVGANFRFSAVRYDTLELPGAVAVLVPAALVFSYKRFVRLETQTVRHVAGLAAGCAAHAFVLGAVLAVLRGHFTVLN